MIEESFQPGETESGISGCRGGAAAHAASNSDTDSKLVSLLLFMGKYKAAKPKSTAPPQMKAGVPCIVFLVLGMLLTMILLYEVIKNAS